jgi:hypothetical protein
MAYSQWFKDDGYALYFAIDFAGNCLCKPTGNIYPELFVFDFVDHKIAFNQLGRKIVAKRNQVVGARVIEICFTDVLLFKIENKIIRHMFLDFFIFRKKSFDIHIGNANQDM